MDTLLPDIIEAHGTITTILYDVECMGSSVSQYYYLQKKLVR